MSRKKTGAITSMSLLLIMMIVVLAFQPPTSAAAEKQQDIHTRVFITKPLCTDESAWELKQGIMLNKYGYAPYTNSSLEVSCFPHVSLLTLDRTVKNLRIMYPDDMFVFVYELSSTADKKASSLISDRWEWNLWLKTYSTVPSTFDYSLLLGKAWIDKGYAIADHNSEVINHEWAHLETCKIHGLHTDEGNPATWQPFFSKNETALVRRVTAESHYKGSVLLTAVEQSFNDFTKAGFARLLKHFEDNTDDVVRLTRAFALATKAHKEHFIDNNEPHVNHSLRTALILAEELQMRDIDVASAALLHDALEGVQEQEVREECGDRVAEMVRTVAEPRPSKHEEGRDKILDEYFARLAKGSKEARCVKLADRLDTARSMKTHAYRESALRFKEEAQRHAVPLAQATDERLAFKLSVALYEIK